MYCKTTKWLTGIVGVILAGYCCLYLYAVEARMSELFNSLYCHYDNRYVIYLFMVDSILYSFGPFILMTITNLTIVFKLMRAECKSRHNTESTDQALAKSATRGTAMVVTVSVTFLLLTAPTAVHSILARWYDLVTLFPLYRPFMNSAQYLNHSINGVLYCIVGSRFRKELFDLFYRRFKS